MTPQEKQKAYRLELISRGLCYRCGAPRARGVLTCETCRRRDNRAGVSAYRNRVGHQVRPVHCARCAAAGHFAKTCRRAIAAVALAAALAIGGCLHLGAPPPDDDPPPLDLAGAVTCSAPELPAGWVCYHCTRACGPAGEPPIDPIYEGPIECRDGKVVRHAFGDPAYCPTVDGGR